MELQPWEGWSVAFDFIDEGLSDRNRALLVTNRLEPGLYLEERLSHDPLLDDAPTSHLFTTCRTHFHLVMSILA